MAALSTLQIQFAVRSTISRLGQNPPPTNAQIHAAIAGKLGLTPGPQYAALWTYIRQGRELAAQGAAVQNAPAGSPPVRPTAADAGTTASAATYVYRVALDMHDPGTLSVGSWLVEVRSAEPLSALEAIDKAMSMVMSDPNRNGRYDDRVASPDPSSYSGRVVTAGVR